MHFTTARAEIGRDAALRWTAIDLGGRIGKARMESRLSGPGSSVRVTGLYALDGDQHLDLDTTQEHAAPNATSDLAFKGVLQGHSRSVWRGIIRVDEGAQKTDAFQENRNMLAVAARARRLDPRPRDPRERRALHARRDRGPGRPRAAVLPDVARLHPDRRRPG